jgi:hypothetical protein
MAESNHYCAECGHFGGPPNNISPEEHAEIEHDGGLFQGIEDGTKEDFERKQAFSNLNIPER